MVRFTVLASGSKGNSTVVCGGQTRILVDAGLSCRELFRRMSLAGEAPETLDAIIITHEHMDHIGGLAVTARKLGIPVYFTEATHRAWMRWITPRRHMTYAQWIEQCRQQAAARQAEADALTSANATSWTGSGFGSVRGGRRANGPDADPTETGRKRPPSRIPRGFHRFSISRRGGLFRSATSPSVRSPSRTTQLIRSDLSSRPRECGWRWPPTSATSRPM